MSNSKRARLHSELGSLLKKSLRLFFKGDVLDPYIEIDRQLSGFFEAHPELEIEPDIIKSIQTTLEPLINNFSASAKTLENLISGYGEMMKGKMLSKEVTVRSKGRATLSMFPSGTRLRITELHRRDGSLGGVELIVK